MLLLIAYMALKYGIALGRIKQQDGAFPRIKYLGDKPGKAVDKVFKLISGINEAVNAMDAGN
jgi:hypothetical protein